MAGMFSMLNNSHLRIDGLGSSSQWDEAGGGRGTPSTWSPFLARKATYINRQQSQATSSHAQRPAAGRDRLPKSIRKQQISQMHPIIRRSVCTIILAAVAVTTGLVFLLIDLLVLNQTISIRGFVVIGAGVLVGIIGLLWLKHSFAQLKVLNDRIEKTREARKKQLTEHHRFTKDNFPNAMTTLVMHCNVHCATKDVVGERSDIQFRVTTPSGRSYSGTSRTKVDLSSSDEEVFVEKGSCLPTSNCGKGDDQRRHLNVNNRVSDFFRHKPKRSERSEHSHCHDQHSLDSSYFSKPSNRNSGFSVNSFMEDTALRDFGGGNHPQCHDVTVTSRFLQPT